MKIFISSLISGFEPFRMAARQAVAELGHKPIMAEDFAARPTSSQIACLDGVRQSGLVILMLGEAYGSKQGSGLSATHEEYREARDTKPVIGFVQEGVTPDPDEAAFLKEVQEWSQGLFRGGFRAAEELRGKIIRAIHDHEMSRAAGPVDAASMLQSALALLPPEQRGYSRSDRYLSLAAACGPQQAILRPSQIEASALAEHLEQFAMFGKAQVFERKKGVEHKIEDGCLVLFQEGETAVYLHPQGDLLLTLPLPRERDSFGGVIEEDVAGLLDRALVFVTAVMDHVDATQRLTHVALAASLSDAQYMTWRTRAEVAGSSSRGMSYGIGMGKEPSPVHLTPPVRPRAALAHDRQSLVEDLITLLRREYRRNS